MTDRRLRISAFGPITVVRDGAPVTLTAAERRVLAGLVMAFPAAVSEDRLTELVWEGREPPRTARQSLQNHVSRLRQKLGAGALARHPGAYALDPGCEVDLHALRSGLDGLRSEAEHRPAAVLADVEALRAVAGGTPLVDLAEDHQAAALRASLVHAVEDLHDLAAELLLRLGHTERALTELQHLTAADPGRERRWELLMVALDRSGRRGDALAAYHRARAALIEAYGVEPGPALRRTHQRMLEASGAMDDGARAVPPLGRDREIEEAMGSLTGAGVVHVVGPAGIGKSALLREVARRWPGPVLRVSCADSAWSALAPVEHLLRDVAGAVQDPLVPRSLADLRDPISREQLGRLRQPLGVTERAARAVVAGLRRLHHPLLLVDDIDRAGPSTRDVLVDVARSGATACALSSRVEPLPGGASPGWEVVELGGLEGSAIAGLVGDLLDIDPGEVAAAADWLEQQTGGHPLYVHELLGSIGDERPWARSPSDRDRLALSPSLSAILQARLAAVPAAARELLDGAAVLGDPLDVPLLRGIADIGQLPLLESAGILVRSEQGQLRFAHALFAAAAYESVPPGRREELHHALGLLSNDPTVRANHLRHAADLDPDATIAALAAAGRASLDDQAYANAAMWFGEAAAHAMGHGHPPVDVLDLEIEARDCARLAGQRGHAEPLLDLAEQALESGHVDLRRRATVAAVQLGEAVDPGPLQQRAVAIADRAVALEADPVWRSRLLGTASILHSISGDPERCRTMFVDAVADLDPNDDHTACDVLPYAYMALAHPDDLPAREAATNDLLRAARRTGDRTAEWEGNHLLCSVAMSRGDGDVLRAAFAECERLLADAGAAGRRWSNVYLAAAIAAIDGRDEDAEALAERVLLTGSGVAPARAMGAASGQLLGIRWRQGRLEELADPLGSLIDTQPEIPSWKAAGSLVLAGQDPARAAELFDEVVTARGVGLPRDFAWLAGVLCLGGAAARMRDAERAQRVLPHLVPYVDITCWQGTCTYGPVAAVAADLAAVTGDAREAAWRETARALHHRLAGTGGPART